MKIWLDMDGTIADLYGVHNWLPMLQAGKTHPYKEAKPLCDMQALTKAIQRLQAKGHEVGIITWAAKNASHEYIERIAKAKKQWLEKWLPTVRFNEVVCTPYGLNKSYIDGGGGLLVDDDPTVRASWEGIAIHPNNVAEQLHRLAR